MFQFSRYPTKRYNPERLLRLIIPQRDGLPHSEILGSKHEDCSPKHIGVFSVLPRYNLPRHPLSALLSSFFLTAPLRRSVAPCGAKDDYDRDTVKIGLSRQDRSSSCSHLRRLRQEVRSDGISFLFSFQHSK